MKRKRESSKSKKKNARKRSGREALVRRQKKNMNQQTAEANP